jgi:hypothetical protein
VPLVSEYRGSVTVQMDPVLQVVANGTRQYASLDVATPVGQRLHGIQGTLESGQKRVVDIDPSLRERYTQIGRENLLVSCQYNEVSARLVTETKNGRLLLRLPSGFARQVMIGDILRNQALSPYRRIAGPR